MAVGDYHPWFGREVFVHAAIDKADGAVFQCSVDGSDVERWLEVPAWMFDHGACAGDEAFQPLPSSVWKRSARCLRCSIRC